MSQNGMSAPIPTSVNTYSSLTAKNAIIHTTSRWKIEQPKGSKDGPWVPGAPPCGWSPNIPRANLSAPVPEVETAHELEVSLTSVAEVRFSLVLQPFLENREPRTEPTVFGQNRTGTGAEPLKTGSACLVLVLEPVQTGEP